MEASTFNPRVLRACAWFGPAFTLAFLIGVVPLAGLFPPASAASSLEATVALYADHATAVRAGCFVMAISSAMFLPWGLSIIYATRRAETGFPILFWIQACSVALCSLIILLIPMFWGIASFRPGAVSAEITQTWNDAGWFAVLFAWPPFTLLCFAIAASVLGDRSAKPRLPRWVGYLNAWVGMLFVPAGLMIFFKEGAFSWSGVVVFWIPVVTIFIWIVTMSVVILKVIAAEQHELEREPTTTLREPTVSASREQEALTFS